MSSSNGIAKGAKRSPTQDEATSLIDNEVEADSVSRPPSYGAVADANPSQDIESTSMSKDDSPRKTTIDSSALACLLLQHTSSAMANNLYHFTTFIFLVEVYKDTLAPASCVGLVTMLSAFLFSGAVGNIIDRTPRLKVVRSAVALQKCIIVMSFSIFLILFGPMKGLPEKFFHAESTFQEKLLVNTALVGTILCGAGVWMVNVGINVAVERDWVTTIAQGDSECLSMLNSRMVSIDLLTRIAGPMITSAFTMNLSYPAAAKGLIGLVVACGTLELFWIQIVWDRFPILREDEERRGRGKVKLALEENGSDDEGVSPGDGASKGWRAEVAVWSEFSRMPVFFASLAASMTWLTTLHFDATGVAHFKMSAGYSDFFLACIRGACMISCLIGANIMPRIERRIGTGRTGILGLGFGIFCFTLCTIAFFLEEPLKRFATASIRHSNVAVMFGGIILARMGHTNFDLAEIKALQQNLEPHPRRNRMTALQSSLQALFSLLKSVCTIVFASQEAYKWTVLITLLANLGAMGCYLNFLRLDRRGKEGR